MAYDWRRTNATPEGTSEFFAEIDRRFFNASPFFQTDPPFAELIPFQMLHGKRVLEIGCGLGSHTQLLAQAGCRLTAIDLTERAVHLTKQRLVLADLIAEVIEMDAEHMEFENETFDFVWSWGVIHHSEHTDQILREVARVLKTGGEFRFMVYHRRAVDSYFKIVRGLLSGKALRGMTFNDMLSFYTDGYIARFYTRSELSRLIENNGLATESLSVVGQTSELVPLSGVFGRLKSALVSSIPAAIAKTALGAAGSFLFATARKTK